jgi:NAD(P)-dependent dehydrogenase (short-subunit alcohol dehydrogenase family)
MYINDNARIEGKVVIITGCSSGIGKATAHELAKRGGRIYFASRDEEKTTTAINEIKELTMNEQLYFLKLDLSSLDSVRDFCKNFCKLEKKLDILINNAGVLSPLRRTSDGFEMNFGVNHLGHFLLTNLLLDSLKAAAPSRIIIVSSALHEYANINRDDINSERDFPGTFKAYENSKLCNILFMRELSKRLEGTGVVCNALSPFLSDTDATRYLNSIQRFFFDILKKSFLYNSPEVGCQPIVMLAVEPSLSEVTGKYFVQFKVKEPNLRKQNYESWLWDKSEELTKVFGK